MRTVTPNNISMPRGAPVTGAPCCVTTYLSFDSPLGPLTVTGNGQALLSLDWGRPDERLGAAAITHRGVDDPLLCAAADQVQAWLAGTLRTFILPLAPAGTPFQQRVWTAMQGIPYGQTRTYGALAQQIGSAPRAVGGACGRNPIPIIIPCHRVVGGSGLHGYSGFGGLETKAWLLRLETTATRWTLT